MSLSMSKSEREEFLAALHVGVISIAEEGRGPLTVPIWYMYEPGGELHVLTDRDSRKGRLLQEGGRLSLCAQTEAPPYKYVSVEGPILAIEPSDVESHGRPMAHRYLGRELGDAYTQATSGTGTSVLVRVRPERWLTVDYGKQYATQADEVAQS